MLVCIASEIARQKKNRAKCNRQLARRHQGRHVLLSLSMRAPVTVQVLYQYSTVVVTPNKARSAE